MRDAPRKHKPIVELDRYRVTCEDCTWFHYSPIATLDDLRETARQHTRNAKEFYDARDSRD